MHPLPDGAPLTVPLLLTEEQRAQIRRQTGLEIAALPFASSAPFVRRRFGGIELRVRRGVFAPTAATERLLEIAVAAARAHRRPIVVDVGTGCGAVALAIAARVPRATVHATELSDVAVASARRNRARLAIRNVTFHRGSLLSPLPRRLAGRVAVIVANVPYLPPSLGDAAAGLFPAGTAVGSGDDGLDLVREVARQARRLLAPGGSLVIQVAGFQVRGVVRELRRLGYAAQAPSRVVPNEPAVCSATWGARRTGRTVAGQHRDSAYSPESSGAGKASGGRQDGEPRRPRRPAAPPRPTFDPSRDPAASAP